MANLELPVTSYEDAAVRVLRMTRRVSEVNREAVIGAHGAGRSTFLKGLVGEQLPTSGSSGRPQALGPSSWMTT